MPVSRATRRDPPQALLTLAKLQVPNPDAAALERPGLLEELDRHAGRPLTLLTADAGWGKITLAAAFARRRHVPVVWYGLLSSDCDLRVFGRHLLEGFRAGTPRFGASFARLIEDSRPTARGTLLRAAGSRRAIARPEGDPDSVTPGA